MGENEAFYSFHNCPCRANHRDRATTPNHEPSVQSFKSDGANLQSNRPNVQSIRSSHESIRASLRSEGASFKSEGASDKSKAANHESTSIPGRTGRIWRSVVSFNTEE